MKKIFYFILVLLNPLTVSAQNNTYKLSDFKTVSVSQSNTISPTFQNFLRQNPTFDVNLVETNYDVHTLVDPDELVLVCKIKNPRVYNYCYISYNKKADVFYISFVNKTTSTIVVYNQRGTKLYTSRNSNGAIVLTNDAPAQYRTCFQYCMDYVEAQITTDALGWAAWNLSPATQIAAAYGCRRACNPGIPVGQF